MGWSLSIVKMSIVSKLPRFKAIPNKSLIEKFIEINKLFLKFLGNAKDRIAKATLKKHNKVEHKHYWISRHIATEAAKSLQSCLTLCDPINGSPPGSPIPGILQARTLEWVAISFSNEWMGKVKVKSISRVRLWATPWTAAHQAPPSMGLSRQEYWSGLPLPSPFSTLENLLYCLQSL